MVRRYLAVLLIGVLLQCNEAGKDRKKGSRRASAHQGSSSGAADEGGSGAGTSGRSDSYHLANTVGSLTPGAGSEGGGEGGSSRQKDTTSTRILIMPKDFEYIVQSAHEFGEGFDRFNLRGHLSDDPVIFSDQLVHLTMDRFVLLGSSSPSVTRGAESVSLKVKGNYAVCAAIYVELLVGAPHTIDPNQVDTTVIDPDVVHALMNTEARDFLSSACVTAKRGSVFVFEALFNTSPTGNEGREFVGFMADQLQLVLLDRASPLETSVLGKHVAAVLRQELLNKLSVGIGKALSKEISKIVIRSEKKTKNSKPEDVVRVRTSVGLTISQEPSEQLDDMVPTLVSLRAPPTKERRRGAQQRRRP